MSKTKQNIAMVLLAVILIVDNNYTAKPVFATPGTAKTCVADSVDSEPPLADAEADLIDGAGTNTRYIMGVCATAVTMLILMGFGLFLADRKAKK